MVRICTINVPRFVHDGLDVGFAWTEVDAAKLPEPARQALVDYVGTLIQVHPDDGPELARAGLEFAVSTDGRRRLRATAKAAAVKAASKT